MVYARYYEDLGFVEDARSLDRDSANLRLLTTSFLDKVRYGDNEGIVFVLRLPLGYS